MSVFISSIDCIIQYLYESDITIFGTHNQFPVENVAYKSYFWIWALNYWLLTLKNVNFNYQLGLEIFDRVIGLRHPLFGFHFHFFPLHSISWNTHPIVGMLEPYISRFLQVQCMFQFSCPRLNIWILSSIWETNLTTREPIFGFCVLFLLQWIPTALLSANRHTMVRNRHFLRTNPNLVTKLMLPTRPTLRPTSLATRSVSLTSIELLSWAMTLYNLKSSAQRDTKYKMIKVFQLKPL